jgi:hypothetical protein
VIPYFCTFRKISLQTQVVDRERIDMTFRKSSLLLMVAPQAAPNRTSENAGEFDLGGGVKKLFGAPVSYRVAIEGQVEDAA